MKEILSVLEWAVEVNKYVRHLKFGEVLLVGVRTQCESNNNLMLNIKVGNEYFWVYDYETYRIEHAPIIW